jgi:hypothetical protein
VCDLAAAYLDGHGGPVTALGGHRAHIEPRALAWAAVRSWLERPAS